MASQTINTIHPMIGIRPTSNHQPLFPMSCMRRTPSAIPGMNVAIPKSDYGVRFRDPDDDVSDEIARRYERP